MQNDQSPQTKTSEQNAQELPQNQHMSAWDMVFGFGILKYVLAFAVVLGISAGIFSGVDTRTSQDQLALVEQDQESDSTAKALLEKIDSIGDRIIYAGEVYDSVVRHAHRIVNPR